MGQGSGGIARAAFVSCSGCGDRSVLVGEQMVAGAVVAFGGNGADVVAYRQRPSSWARSMDVVIQGGGTHHQRALKVAGGRGSVSAIVETEASRWRRQWV